MKIRTDFVTNSSSSSFITIVATKKDGSVIVDKLECDGNADDHIYFSECIDELVNQETKNGSMILDNIQKMYNNPRMDYLLDQSGEKHLLRNITDLKLLKKIEFSEEIFGDILDCITCIDEEGDFVCPASSQITISYNVEKDEYSEPFITAKNSDGDALEIFDESELYDEDADDNLICFAVENGYEYYDEPDIDEALDFVIDLADSGDEEAQELLEDYESRR